MLWKLSSLLHSSKQFLSNQQKRRDYTRTNFSSTKHASLFYPQQLNKTIKKVTYISVHSCGKTNCLFLCTIDSFLKSVYNLLICVNFIIKKHAVICITLLTAKTIKKFISKNLDQSRYYICHHVIATLYYWNLCKTKY